MKNLSIKSRSGTYVVQYCHSLARPVQDLIHAHPTHILIDRTIWALYKQVFQKKDYASIQLIDAKEKNKSLPGVLSYVQFLLKHNIQRHHVILVVGGGVVQDIGGFSAHIILRGVDWVFVPTTLLAMADSCIGSKSAINVGKYKNQIGAFYPPRAVYMYPEFLKSLPEERILDGKGEMIKHAVIAGGRNFAKHISDLANISKDRNMTHAALNESLRVKKSIIEQDEFDTGRRKLLNYGHTFGHALEGYTQNSIPHGTAVIMGMDIANFISYKRGLLSEKAFVMLSTILHHHIPYDTFPVKQIGVYMDFLKRDKKVKGDVVWAILCRGVGRVFVTPVKLDSALVAQMNAYRVYYQKLRKQIYETSR